MRVLSKLREIKHRGEINYEIKRYSAISILIVSKCNVFIMNMSVKPQSHRVVQFLNRAIDDDWRNYDQSARFATTD